MQGYSVLWIPGLDHAGIATHTVVERELMKRMPADSTNPRLIMGRDAFVQEVWAWKERHALRIREQLACLGLSLDWDREFFTLSPHHTRAVTEAFVRLYEEGLIYRASAPVSWCCALRSTISDIEVEKLELRKSTTLPVPGYKRPQQFGIVDYFAYPLATSPTSSNRTNEEIVVSTTRLETMLADTALIVHPDDTRYHHLIGREVIHPFCPNRRRIPILADAEFAVPDKGSGVVKLSPGHSTADWEYAKSHDLPVIHMLDDSGCVTDVGGEFSNLPRFSARERLVERLNELGLYRGREDIASQWGVSVLPRCSRTGDIIEPVIREQWFIRTQEMADRAKEAALNGQLLIYPESQRASWFDWLSPSKQRDWCISRQVWWGHRIPAYRLPRGSATLDTTNHWLVARSEQSAKEQLGVVSDSVPLEQDPDVLDTWFSSSLLPFSVLGWPDQTSDLRLFYPMQLLETGQDILFFWVARMVMIGWQLTKQLPFKTVILHGLICDPSGQKMSKSKGNVVDPLDLVHGLGSMSSASVGPSIKTIGADALRASLLGCSLFQPQVPYHQMSALEMRRFGNKVWQTARFTQMRTDTSKSIVSFKSLEDFWAAIGNYAVHLRLPDVWLIHRLADLVLLIQNTWTSTQCSTERRSIRDHIEPFGFHHGVNRLRHWWIEELCSIYMEILKLRERASDSRYASSFELFRASMLTGLCLLHPIMPHLTEVIWQGLHAAQEGSALDTISLQAFPRSEWFTFLDAVDNLSFKSQHMSNLLEAASTANSWRLLLRRRPTEQTSGQALFLLQLHNHNATDESEVLAALTRLSVFKHLDEVPSSITHLSIGLDSSWCLAVDLERFDLDWTLNELQRRIESQTKRRHEILNQSDQSDLSQKAKLDSIDARLAALQRQMNILQVRQHS
ncbi:unnamed protein product [Dicrocoelium dendriticum]|nr:unnamed protein product [Dicrocoelium dendriticum]